MVQRLLIAVAGAGLITVALLLGMNRVALIFKERDPIQYFQISGFTAAPENRRPKPPPAPQMPPERPRIELDRSGDARAPVVAPTVDEERLAPPPLVPDPDPETP